MPYELDLVPCEDRRGLEKSLAEAVALVTRRADINDALLAQANRLRLIQQVGVGTDRIDLAAATRRGIAVANTPGAPSTAVIEHAFLLMLAAARNFAGQVDTVRRGAWSGVEVWEGTELCGSTIGIVGYGSIGRGLARRARAFDARVLVSTRTPPVEPQEGIAFTTLATLLHESDMLVLAPALTPQTRGLIGRAELARMKPSAILVNISRGAVLDEPALLESLRAGRLRGAALDAFAQEPLPADSPLRNTPGLLATPHIAGSSQQSRRRIWDQIMANLEHLANGDPLQALVNAGPALARR
jgi:phosphoglycerate dehydrogenase-like enzyme